MLLIASSRLLIVFKFILFSLICCCRLWICFFRSLFSTTTLILLVYLLFILIGIGILVQAEEEDLDKRLDSYYYDGKIELQKSLSKSKEGHLKQNEEYKKLKNN